MNEEYNRYRESLIIDCDCNKNDSLNKKAIVKSSNCCEGGLPSHNNTIEVLIRQLKREVKELMNTTQAKLLCQDKKIAEVVTYIKNNLSNYIRDLIDSMEESGELDEIIKSVITTEITIMNQDIETLKYQMETVKNDITDLKADKLEFQEYEESDIYNKFPNIEVSTEYVNNSIIYITKLKNLDSLAVLPTNGDVNANINDNKLSIKAYADTHDEYDVYMNCGMSGIYIFNGVVNQTTRLDCPYYCGFKENGEMKFYEGLSQNITPDILVADNIVNCFSGFAPIIVNHEEADYTSINNLYGSNEIATKFIDSLPVKHPRQLIAQDDDNNFTIFSIMGRFNNCEGFNYEEMKSYFLSKGFKNVFSADGGGSTQTIVNKNNVFYPTQELDTNTYREVPSVLCFKLKEVE